MLQKTLGPLFSYMFSFWKLSFPSPGYPKHFAIRGYVICGRDCRYARQQAQQNPRTQQIRPGGPFYLLMVPLLTLTHYLTN